MSESAKLTPHVPDSPWSKELPGLQTAWDATSMNLLQTCPRKYYYSQVLHYRVKTFQAPLSFGILMHKALETYHGFKAKGQEHDEAAQGAMDFCLSAGKELDQSTETERTRFTLTRAVVWYLDQFRTDPAETIILSNGKPAVELSFRVAMPLDTPDGLPYLWCGHIDRLVSLEDRIGVSDIKTTKYSLSDNWFQRFSPSNQMSGYLFGCMVILPEEPCKKILIDAIELKVNFNRFLRGFANRTTGQIEEWVKETGVWIKMAEQFAEQEHWPMNLEICDKYGGCPFRKNVC